MGILYIVATPIGNREDITLKALRTLREVDVILCEDTRKTRQLLAHHNSSGRGEPMLISYFEENEEQRIPEVIEKLKQGKSIALVSNAGTPLISDPGFKLVRQCYKEGIIVSPIPGPSSPVAALSASGLPTDKFLFIGYLPKRKGKRIKILNEIKEIKNIGIKPTIIIFESPHRLKKTLEDLYNIFGNIEITIARELTKIHEVVKKDFLENLLNKQEKIKGEIVLLF